jgi:hypothetical protein
VITVSATIRYPRNARARRLGLRLTSCLGTEWSSTQGKRMDVESLNVESLIYDIDSVFINGIGLVE